MFDVEVWLVSVAEEVPHEAVRAYWNVKETPLVNVIDASPSIWVGTSEAPYPANLERRGPVGRLTDVIALRGTLPDYSLPTLDEQLEEELLDVFAPRPNDPPFEVVDRLTLSAWLQKHRGTSVVYRSRSLDTM
jgi:hypothetical protein